MIRETATNSGCRTTSSRLSTNFMTNGLNGCWSRASRMAVEFMLVSPHRNSTKKKLPVHHKPAIDVDGLPGDVLGAVRGEEDGHGGHVGGVLPAAERDDAANFLVGPRLISLLLLGRLLAVPCFPDGLVERRLH